MSRFLNRTRLPRPAHRRYGPASGLRCRHDQRETLPGHPRPHCGHALSCKPFSFSCRSWLQSRPESGPDPPRLPLPIPAKSSPFPPPESLTIEPQMEQPSSAFSTGVPALTAIPQPAGNSRQGFGLQASTSCLGSGFPISSNTLGLSTSLYDSDAGSRSTGKERDTESGNDYFGLGTMHPASGASCRRIGLRRPSPCPTRSSITRKH